MKIKYSIRMPCKEENAANHIAHLINNGSYLYHNPLEELGALEWSCKEVIKKKLKAEDSSLEIYRPCNISLYYIWATAYTLFIPNTPAMNMIVEYDIGQPFNKEKFEKFLKQE